MDTDRIKGPVTEGAGKVKEEWGDLRDDPATEAEGKIEQVKGQIQNTWGETKDTVRDAADDDEVTDDAS